MRAVLYARLSLDRNGEGVAVARQLEDCRAIAASRGWEVVGEFTDNSVSAWKAGVRRPGWEAMLEAVGGVDALVVWHGDRLIRQPRDLERLIDLADGGLTIASVAGERDLSKPDDRFILRIEVAAQCRESDSTSRRVRRVMAQRATEGRRQGMLPYGWREPGEADVVREIIERILAGDSLHALTRDLNERKVAPPKAETWSRSLVRAIARRAANAGLRTYRGEVVAEHRDLPALVSRGDWERVVRILDDPKRRSPNASGTKHLLSGILTCGKCGTPMLHARPTPARAVYKCPASNHLTVAAQPTEDWILALVDARLEDAGIRVSGFTEAPRAELLALRERKDALADAFATGDIDRAQLRSGTALLDSRIEAATQALADAEAREDVSRLVGADVLSMPVERQRAVIRALLSIRVLPHVPGAPPRWHPDRLEVTWN